MLPDHLSHIYGYTYRKTTVLYICQSYLLMQRCSHSHLYPDLTYFKSTAIGFKSYVHTCKCEHLIVHVQLAVLEYMYLHPRTYKPTHHDKSRYNYYLYDIYDWKWLFLHQAHDSIIRDAVRDNKRLHLGKLLPKMITFSWVKNAQT